MDNEIAIAINEEVLAETVAEIVEETTNTQVNDNLALQNLACGSIDNLLKNCKIRNFSNATEVVDVVKNRTIVIGDIDADTGDIIDNVVRFWNTYDKENNIPVAERNPIKIYINSNGGDFISTLTGMDAIENSITPVWTVNVGKAYSGGLFLLLAGHKRLAYKRASFLFHEGSCGGVGGDANKFQNYADFYKDLRAMMKDIMLTKTNMTDTEYEKHSKDDWWFFANEALEKGIIDQIIESRDDIDA